jgi:hypothetical protein
VQQIAIFPQKQLLEHLLYLIGYFNPPALQQIWLNKYFGLSSHDLQVVPFLQSIS